MENRWLERERAGRGRWSLRESTSHLHTMILEPPCSIRCPAGGLDALTTLSGQQVHESFHLLCWGASAMPLASLPARPQLLLSHGIRDCYQELQREDLSLLGCT